MGQVIQVVFIDANSGQIIAHSQMPLEQLPASFESDTTIQIREKSWSVERAEPATSAEFAQAGQLELVLRPLETVPLRDILYSLPTICDQLPVLDPDLDRSRCLVLHEDDWRQREFVTADQLAIVEEQCAAIRRIYSEHAHPAGEVTAFDSIHVRTTPVTPITAPISLDRIEALLPPATRRYGGVSLHGGSGAVPNSFAIGYQQCVLYGLIGPGGVHVLAVHGDDVAAVEPLRTLGLSLVDWLSCTSS